MNEADLILKMREELKRLVEAIDPVLENGGTGTIRGLASMNRSRTLIELANEWMKKNNVLVAQCSFCKRIVGDYHAQRCRYDTDHYITRVLASNCD
jgi:hypothetical protein